MSMLIALSGTREHERAAPMGVGRLELALVAPFHEQAEGERG